MSEKIIISINSVQVEMPMWARVDIIGGPWFILVDSKWHSCYKLQIDARLENVIVDDHFAVLTEDF